jgi:ATP-binding cassette, subfamily B, bacterial
MFQPKKFPKVLQYDEMDCGPNCLKIICQYYGKDYSLNYLRELCNTTRVGTNMLALQEAAEALQLEATGIKISFTEIDNSMLPCIAYWQQKHFVVIYKIADGKIFISDPAHGLISYTKADFLKAWAIEDDHGILLTIETTELFFKSPQPTEAAPAKKMLQKFVVYLSSYKRQVFLIILTLVLLGVLQVAFPIITQNLVDKGIYPKNISYIYLLLLAQFLFFIGRTSAEIMNTYALLKLGNKVNIRLVTEFLSKLFKLPLSYFDVKMSGDILQRINDLGRIEFFLTHSALNVLFSVINLLIFGAVLYTYNWQIFLLFLIGSVLYFLWFRFFLKKRAVLDYKNFSKLSQRQEKNIEMIYGMSEIKLNNAGDKKKEEWESLQKEVFQINVKSVRLSQWQQKGAAIINEIKNIAITFFAAYLVVHDQLSLGMMMSITYIVGQLNGPVAGLLDFMQQYQDAQLSTQRINEIQDKKEEQAFVKNPTTTAAIEGDIVIKNLSFQYDKTKRAKGILDNMDITIPCNKTTAIVGHSGCGKTTLLKLLLKFYEPSSGSIYVGNIALASLPHDHWRKHCGTVLQDAYIFSDTIANNIVLQTDALDSAALDHAIGIANLTELIQQLPLGIHTKIGANGVQLSGGEKQRILIARAIYRNPSYVFLDEATSSLDTHNESEIINKLHYFLQNKTVIVIAHRLSTIKNADQIIVMQDGKVVEIGTHDQLLKNNAYYAHLVQKQLSVV